MTTSPDRSAAHTEEKRGPTAVQTFLTTGSTVKVYVRNLPWSTTEEDLKSFFAPVGKVVNALIPHRRGRALGYAFVAFETQQGADRAITESDKKSLGDRVISVQTAILRTDEELKELSAKRQASRASRGRSGRRPGQREGSRTERSSSRQEKRIDEAASPKKEGTESSARGRGGRRGGRGGRRAERPERAEERRPQLSEEEQAQSAKDAAADDKRIRQFDYARTLYVGNLPWKMTQEELASIFREEKPTAVCVPRMRMDSGKIRGYGLVEFPSADVLKLVLQDYQSVYVNGRALVLKEARPPREQEAN